MYLAEDRILCLHIFAMKDKRYKLMYLPNAFSEVDPVTSLAKLIG